MPTRTMGTSASNGSRNALLRHAIRRAGAPLMTLATAGIVGSALLQTAAAEQVEEIVVVGQRQSMETSQQIKMDADTFVDSITATDIGAFPDKSVAEALQRVPGITVSRLQSSDDSTHFSAEPASVLVRGLTFVRTEFNGRDSFSADGYRGLNFNDISPELMAGVDTYKNQTAEMIEGGISGVVNLRTRLPFDTDGQVISLTGRANYGDRSDDTTYEASGIYSNTWDTDIGRIGAMINYAYSHVRTQTEGVVMQRIGAFCNGGNTDANGNPIMNPDGTVACTSTPYGGTNWQYMPRQVNFSQVLYDRERHGASAALQFESKDNSVLATLQYINSEYDNPWLERSSNVGFFDMWGAPAYSPQTTANIGPAQGTPAFTFGPDGMLRSGVMTRPSGSGDWFGTDAEIRNRASVVPGLPYVNSCADGCDNNRQAFDITNEARNFGHTEGTQDISLNLRWDINDRMRATFDAQHIEADTNNYDILVASRTMADVQYGTNGDGTPTIKLLPGSNVNYAEGGLANPHNYYIPFIQDHWEDNDAEENAFRADFEYDISDTGWLDSLKVGVRHADREQKVRYSSFNWSPVAAPWNCNGPGFSVDNTAPANYGVCGDSSRQFLGYGSGIWESVTLGDFYNGNVYDSGPLVYLNRPTLANRDAHIQALSGATTGSPMAWNPLCERATNVEGCFTSPELVDVNETSKAAYLMLKFGGEDSTLFGMKVRGNVGVRYVETEVTSSGGVAFPTSTWYTNTAATPCNTPLTDNVTNISCWLTPELLAFSNSGGADNDLGTTYENWLPSFNVRFGLTESQFVRFGYSRSMSRPDFGLLRNFVGIQDPILNDSADSPYVIRNSAGQVTGYNFVFNADSGYGALKPITADNFDLSYENYFGKSSSFTVGLFYKKMNGAIAFGEFDREFENNGTTQVVTVRGPRNGEGGGTLKGIEVGFQTFFDFLPGAWSGLGTQLNYTHVDQSGINNSNLAVQPGYAAGGTIAFGGGLQVNGAVLDSHRLAGISDDAYNVVALYEYGPIGARLAYSWRSEFLTNNLDCCIGLPMWQKASGYLDGSIRYQVSNNIEVSLDASNILNTTTVNQQQVFGDSAATPGGKPVLIDSAWIRSDRRYQLGVRFKY
ncbi:MAG TPA: TonB-dependent receptor [Povalibacter sp.]|uniref:TonB-dependent receptor n=1 Tax=Povalibacter sp. TaxID=1962978 RepID=UPI002C7B2A21|nr:TonB-dependent receptor [Povalibacter sp.]HMN46612.1 TonB-dependent receptor [Povalibacter sp.]